MTRPRKFAVVGALFAVIALTATYTVIRASRVHDYARKRQHGAAIAERARDFRKATGRLPLSLVEMGLPESSENSFGPYYSALHDGTFVVWYADSTRGFFGSYMFSSETDKWTFTSD